MQLSDMLAGMDIRIEPDFVSPKIKIKGLTCDSRRVREGWLFAALSGRKTDGRNFINHALKQGALAILAPCETADQPACLKIPEPHSSHSPPLILRAQDPKHTYARLAARFYTPQPETLIAVTGTNGKTSTVEFLRQIWAASGHQAASLGTLGARSCVSETETETEEAGKEAKGKTLRGAQSDREEAQSDRGETQGDKEGKERTQTEGTLPDNPGLTTPDAADLHAELTRMARQGITHVALEASSHGLDQRRLDGLTLTAAAFTNLSRDHLDYHSGMEAYFAAKQRLFGEILPASGVAVLNADTPNYAALETICKARKMDSLSYGYQGRDIQILATTPIPATASHPACTRLKANISGRNIDLSLPLIGSFQISNALCGLALALACGETLATTLPSLGKLQGVRGRMQRVAACPEGAEIYIDYAHTPDALEAALNALRPYVRGKLWVIFGCGGERDQGKRPLMGDVARRRADMTIITDDNPRNETAATIRQEIAKGYGNPSSNSLQMIAGRADAIRETIPRLQSGDILLVAGKGHETHQIIGGTRYPFDDTAIIKTALGLPDETGGLS